MGTIQVANAPCSWGSLEFEGMEAKPITYGQMLDELAETGYTGTELGDWGFMPTDPEVLRGELERRGLTMVGAFVPLGFRKVMRLADEALSLGLREHDCEAHLNQILAQALNQVPEGGPELGHVGRVAALLAAVTSDSHKPLVILADENGTVLERTKNAGRITASMGLTDMEWAHFGAIMNATAEMVLEEDGLSCVFHHHCAGYVETPDEIARLMDATDPDRLSLLLDTGHYVYGAGGDGDAVFDALERFAGRIGHVHFKDCDPAVAAEARTHGWDYFEAVRHGVFCELGKGAVDFAAVLDWLRRHEYSGWITVEQDVLPGMGTPKESARRNREFLRGIGV